MHMQKVRDVTYVTIIRWVSCSENYNNTRPYTTETIVMLPLHGLDIIALAYMYTVSPQKNM